MPASWWFFQLQISSNRSRLRSWLDRIAWVLEMWSSRTVWISSMPRSNGTPLRSAVRNSRGSQSTCQNAAALTNWAWNLSKREYVWYSYDVLWRCLVNIIIHRCNVGYRIMLMIVMDCYGTWALFSSCKICMTGMSGFATCFPHQFTTPPSCCPWLSSSHVAWPLQLTTPRNPGWIHWYYGPTSSAGWLSCSHCRTARALEQNHPFDRTSLSNVGRGLTPWHRLWSNLPTFDVCIERTWCHQLKTQPGKNVFSMSCHLLSGRQHDSSIF